VGGNRRLPAAEAGTGWIKGLQSNYAERGSRGLPLERIYRQLFNPEWYLQGYAKLYRNAGATTRGATDDTIDGMSLDRIQNLIEQLRSERYRWTPARRQHIPKPKGGTRPLSIPIWSDKLLQEVMRTLLEAYYEPQFRNSSHGFRPRRGCHTALYRVRTWTGTVWFIEGDISKCFDRIDHATLLAILREKIHDERFLGLINSLLRAGYLEDWKVRDSPNGTPQGGVISPLLSNVYLDRLDSFVEDELIPAYSRGRMRRMNPEYQRLRRQLRAARQHGDQSRVDALLLARREMPSGDAYDEGFRRLRYVRYADDFLLGFIGPKQEAVEIRDRLGQFLKDRLHLDLSLEKTLITHRSEKARFLGYEVTVTRANNLLDKNGQRQTNGVVALLMPADAVTGIRRSYSRKGKAAHRCDLLNDTDFSIVSRYQAMLRGVYNYYCLAVNVSLRMDQVQWVLQTSLLKTLAAKHKSCVRGEFHRLRSRTEDGRCLLRVEVPREGKASIVAEFGGIPFERQVKPLHGVEVSYDYLWHYHAGKSSELITRLLAGCCELCKATEDIQVHHIRKLADLSRPGRRPPEEWKVVMSSRKRKTLVVCGRCHAAIHAGKYDGISLRSLLPESRVR
jgi:group II intron reverse transcriptase/maturase